MLITVTAEINELRPLLIAGGRLSKPKGVNRRKGHGDSLNEGRESLSDEKPECLLVGGCRAEHLWPDCFRTRSPGLCAAACSTADADQLYHRRLLQHCRSRGELSSGETSLRPARRSGTSGPGRSRRHRAPSPRAKLNHAPTWTCR
jgi:hypothetical protein